MSAAAATSRRTEGAAGHPADPRGPAGQPRPSSSRVTTKRAPRCSCRATWELDWPRTRPTLPAGGPRRRVDPRARLLATRHAHARRRTPNIHRFARRRGGLRGSPLRRQRHSYGLVRRALYGLHGSYWFPRAFEKRHDRRAGGRAPGGGLRHPRVLQRRMNFPEFRDTAWAGPRRGDPRHLPARSRVLREGRDAGGRLRRVARESPSRARCAPVLLVRPDRCAAPALPQPRWALRAGDRLPRLHRARSDHGSPRRRRLDRPREERLPQLGPPRRPHRGALPARARGRGRRRGDDRHRHRDHGGSVFECGFWGHTSNFSPEQVEVDIHHARTGGDARRRRGRPLTSTSRTRSSSCSARTRPRARAQPGRRTLPPTHGARGE